MTGVDASTIIRNMWDMSIAQLFPKNEEDFIMKMLDMNPELCQFPYCWGAVDRCHSKSQISTQRNRGMQRILNFKYI